MTQNFHADRALPRDHIGVVKRMHKGELALFFQMYRVLIRIGIGSTVQHDLGIFAAKAFNRIDLDHRRGFRHDDHRLAFELGRRVCHALRVIARRSSDHALFKLRWRELRHFVVRAANFVRKHGMHILAFQIHLIVNAA